MTTDITHHLHASIDDDLGALHALDTDLATALRRLAFHGVNHLSDRELTRFAGHVKATLIQAQANAQREREILASRRGLVEPQQWPGIVERARGDITSIDPRQPVKPLDLAMLNREVPPPVARASELTISMAAIEASPAMCRALLASGEGDHLDGSPLSGTIVALIRRGLVEPGGDGRHLPLTDKGIRVRDRLRERAGGARG